MNPRDWIDRARAEGLAPAQASEPPRPWPVVLLTGLGAWLAVPPFLVMFFMLFGSAWEKGAMAYIQGGALVALAVVLLRSRGIPLFLEQVAVPLLLTGLTSVAFGLTRDLTAPQAEVAGLVIAVLLIALLTQSWLRLLLGVAAGCLVALVADEGLRQDGRSLWYRGDGVALTLATLLLIIGVAALVLQRTVGREARGASVAAAVEPVLAGWWLVVLGLFMASAGWAFMAPGALRASIFESGAMPGVVVPPQVTAGGWSALLAVGAGGWLARVWRPAAPSRLVLPGLVLTGLAALMPALGGCLLLLALMLSTRRWRLAVVAAAAALWVLGAFYYQWERPLADKALALVAAGAVLAAWAHWLAWKPADAGHATRHPVTVRGAGAVLLAGAVLSLLLVNVLIIQKQYLVANGKPVFVALAPVDPRSLMQGDYMRLNYALPGVGPRWRDDAAPLLWGERPRVVVTLDARRIAQAPRLLAPGEAQPPGTQLLVLTAKDGGWTFVSDGWFFKEGDARRWQAAKYGEFRVLSDGRGLLVRVVGEDLKPL
ncbi:hypothetical protein CDN99_26930 [Roseateles aquatilis]|uniref:DUF4401 domain-containing protein n=1 Tax=Roseateles aquatilis TaxID=431061 RepID=A0A2D0ALT5_9BURK|nr:GDYXXLXY domain-containing protein [Roseateles aquatilis]OWQ83127.1 hypothetical protein CDN99_26930 [Roseateles aquatilis]